MFKYKMMSKFRSDWITTVIVLEKDLETRKKMLGLFIEVAMLSLDRFNHFNALAILAALTDEAVDRLRETWKLLPPTTSKRFDELKKGSSNAKTNLERFVACVPSVGKSLHCYNVSYFGNNSRQTSSRHAWEKSSHSTKQSLPTSCTWRKWQHLPILCDCCSNSKNQIQRLVSASPSKSGSRTIWSWTRRPDSKSPLSCNQTLRTPIQTRLTHNHQQCPTSHEFEATMSATDRRPCSRQPH